MSNRPRSRSISHQYKSPFMDIWTDILGRLTNISGVLRNLLGVDFLKPGYITAATLVMLNLPISSQVTEAVSGFLMNDSQIWTRWWGKSASFFVSIWHSWDTLSPTNCVAQVNKLGWAYLISRCEVVVENGLLYASNSFDDVDGWLCVHRWGRLFHSYW
jgi:hypothetical protein